MANSLLTGLLAANLAAALAVPLVLLLRVPARRLLGAGCAYALWLIPPAAMLASLLPARTIVVTQARPAQTLPTARQLAIVAPATTHTHLLPTIDLTQALLVLWLAGVAVSLILLALDQHRAVARFGRLTADPSDPTVTRAENGHIGPALVGIVRPRLILPADFEARFDAHERVGILAHERAHAAGGHTLINALTALVTAVNWFNPLVHIGAAFARIDQELACDAAVVARHPDQRRAYAAALIKTRLDAAPAPLGCAWPARSQNLLMERLQMIARQKPGRHRLLIGGGAITVLTLSAALAAWSAEPPIVKTGPAPAAAPIPADPLANLGPDASAVFDIGHDPSLMLTETDHGVKAARTLKIGDEYRDGWKITAIAARTATLARAGQTRTVDLTGLPQVAAGPPPSAPVKASASNAAAAPRPMDDGRAEALRLAVAQGDSRQAIALGGSAKDVLAAVMGAPDFPGISPNRIATPETATFANVDGQLGITGTAADGSIRTIVPSDWADIPPPASAPVMSMGPNLKNPRAN